MDLHNAERIHPEWQDLEAGDVVWMAPSRHGDIARLVVYQIVPQKTLVFAILGNGAWSFHLTPIDDQSCRLIARFQLNSPRLWGFLFQYFILVPVHFIMERGTLLGVNKRAERVSSRSSI